MKKIRLLIIGISAIIVMSLIAIAFFALIKEVEDYAGYTYTKAICNESNYCQDYEITCKQGEMLSIKPIIGAKVQNPLSWRDPRSNESDKDLCK